MAMLLQYNTLHGEDAGETSGPSSAPVLDPPTIDLLPCHIPPPPPPALPEPGRQRLVGRVCLALGKPKQDKKALDLSN